VRISRAENCNQHCAVTQAKVPLNARRVLTYTMGRDVRFTLGSRHLGDGR
jgi:hypothetical protein